MSKSAADAWAASAPGDPSVKMYRRSHSLKTEAARLDRDNFLGVSLGFADSGPYAPDRLTVEDLGRTLPSRPAYSNVPGAIVADTSPARGRWAFRPVPPAPRSIVELIRAGTLDAELAATVWLLLDGRVPLIVAGDGPGVGKSTLLGALLDFVPPNVRVVELAGVDETFAWFPQASELGWPGVGRVSAEGPPIRPQETILLATELSDHTPAYTWGEPARIAVRAASIGYGLAATIQGDSLDEVFAQLRATPVGLTDDELSRLGIVLVLRRTRDGGRRVVAAHYVRPVVRDVHGHVQRLGPAVLATWDAGTDAFEQFSWGVTPELAMRIGKRAGDFELEVAARRTLLEALVRDAVIDVAAVRGALARYRAISAVQPVASSAGPPAAAPH